MSTKPKKPSIKEKKARKERQIAYLIKEGKMTRKEAVAMINVPQEKMTDITLAMAVGDYRKVPKIFLRHHSPEEIKESKEHWREVEKRQKQMQVKKKSKIHKSKE